MESENKGSMRTSNFAHRHESMPEIHPPNGLDSAPERPTLPSRRSWICTPPESSTLYTVADTDSLVGIAVKCGCSVAELCRFNKLMSDQIFPGQILYLPSEPICSNSSSREGSTHGSLQNLPDNDMSSEKDLTHEKLMKLGSSTILHRVPAMYITHGQGIVKGILMVSSHRIIFQPMSGDSLVKERGIEPYQVNQRTSSLCACHIHDDLIEFSASPSSPDSTEIVSSHQPSTHREPAQTSREPNSAGGSLGLPKYISMEFSSRRDNVKFWFAIKNDQITALYSDLLVISQENEASNYEIIPTNSLEEIEPRNSSFMGDINFEDFNDKIELHGSSMFWNSDLVNEFAKKLPILLQRCHWKLIYSTHVHGISINTFFRRCKIYGGPSVLSVLDDQGHVFGAFTSTYWRISPKYYGNGECFVFKLLPDMKCFEWTGDNDYFMSASVGGIIVGGGSGKSAIWLDAEFMRGSSYPTMTFGNECLASASDFACQAVEVWGFVDD